MSKDFNFEYPGDIRGSIERGLGIGMKHVVRPNIDVVRSGSEPDRKDDKCAHSLFTKNHPHNDPVKTKVK